MTCSSGDRHNTAFDASSTRAHYCISPCCFIDALRVVDCYYPRTLLSVGGHAGPSSSRPRARRRDRAHERARTKRRAAKQCSGPRDDATARRRSRRRRLVRAHRLVGHVDGRAQLEPACLERLVRVHGGDGPQAIEVDAQQRVSARVEKESGVYGGRAAARNEGCDRQ